jgi:hypothetical protein
MTPEEKAAKKRAYHTEWQQRNKDKVRAYNERYFVRKAAKILQQQSMEKGGEGNEQARI